MVLLGPLWVFWGLPGPYMLRPSKDTYFTIESNLDGRCVPYVTTKLSLGGRRGPYFTMDLRHSMTPSESANPSSQALL